MGIITFLVRNAGYKFTSMLPGCMCHLQACNSAVRANICSFGFPCSRCCTRHVARVRCTLQGLQLSLSLFAFLQGLQFSDKDEHMYFWFPLLAGLSELTFDPRQDIRYSALEVLFDTLMFHGSAFTLPFWTRIFDSVLLPIFDHVRAEVGRKGRCTSAVAFMLLARHCCCSAVFD